MAKDWTWLKTQSEGQFLERKSCYERSGIPPRPCPIKEVVRAVAEALVAMANADGGTVAIGIEDDGTVSGVPDRFDRDTICVQLHDLVRPRLNFRFEQITLEGQRVWVFETDWSAEVHQLTDGRYLLRVGEQSLPFPAGDIAAMKQSRLQRATEVQFLSDATLADLETDLLLDLARKSGLTLSVEDTLIHFKLVEKTAAQLRLTLAAVLLFAKDPTHWHPRCGIEFIRWEGTERHTGAELNITKRIRMEAPLVRLVEEAHRTIRAYIPERQQLVDLFFEERLVYPSFAWQEAIVNAVAHRDYRLQGLGIEVHLFDDRMEVWSPGGLVEPATIERLRNRERVHASRNPRIVRVLTAFGYMRELGEGIPRMFEVMEGQGLHPPEFRLEGGRFVVILRNAPVYRPETMRWLRQFEGEGLSRNQTRLLAYAHEHGDQFTSRAYQKLVGVDVYTASKDIKDLIRKGIVRLTKPQGRVYELVTKAQMVALEKPPEFVSIEPILQEKGFVKNEDVRKVLGMSRIQAFRLLQTLTEYGFLEKEGKGRGARYVPSKKMLHR
jgi:ATP-dependent DNA helicase RecG